MAADDALMSAVEAENRTSERVDKKFEEAILLLSRFEEDFLSKDPTSDPNIGGTTGEAKMSDKSESPSTILSALKKNLHSKVKFPSVSLPLATDESKPMSNKRSKRTRVVKFYLLSTLPDAYPIFVPRECYAVYVAPST
jgi:hypothetical protein